MKKNYVVDIAFVVEGKWDKFEDIPYKELLKGLRRRMKYIESTDGQGEECFGFDGDSHEVTPGFEICQECGLSRGSHFNWCSKCDTDGCGIPGRTHHSHKRVLTKS